ncbi:MAG: PilW family protein, partial [Fluviibacter sp.]
METLIAMVLGLMVLAGILQFVSRLVEANTTTLKTTRLEQDVRTLMDMMVQDIRPAGQFPGAASDLGMPVRFITNQPTAPTIDRKPLHAGQRGSSLSYAYQEADG